LRGFLGRRRDDRGHGHITVGRDREALDLDVARVQVLAHVERRHIDIDARRDRGRALDLERADEVLEARPSP
jgi:hypothetical protein